MELDGSVVGEEIDWNERIPWDDNMKDVEIELPDSIFQLLKHNNPPSPQDILQSKEYQDGLAGPFTSVDSRIQSITSQIVALQEELQNLEIERIGYAKQSKACDIAISPIRHLPPELVQEIAYYLVPLNDHIMSSRNDLLSISRVCSSWRTAAISMPRLWNQFEIDTTYSALPRNQMKLKTTTLEYSKRAQSLPLYIKVFLSDFEFRGTKHESSHRFLSWLVSQWPSINQVRGLQITSFRFLEVLAIELTEPGAFDSLERLVILHGRSTKVIRNVIAFDNDTVWGDLFANAPGLRRLSVGKGSVGEHLHNLHIPFKQVTHLFLDVPISFSRWALLLKSFSALQFGFFFLLDRPGSQQIDSPCLEGLSLFVEDFSGYPGCLMTIQTGHFPKLSHLELHVSSSERWPSQNAPPAPGLPSLKTLSLFFMQTAPIEALLSVLRNSPDVTTLELGLPASQWGPLLSALTHDDSGHQSQILPLLSTLVVQVLVPLGSLSWTGTYFDTEPCQELVDMIHSRFAIVPEATGQSLHSVSLLLVKHPNYELIANATRQALLPYINAGLSFQTFNRDSALEDERSNSYLSAEWEICVPGLYHRPVLFGR
ncbi:hypothetical protein GALMADRAFT_265729 [Galerina marginata CBS 339.88]|uniref:F-box domain-containing protein n=1 Tax=Galerina marginata (strain CBS 339.88) TaxID=685588 RepID=A0A067TJT3_GALM3|nr:hypothetical protein GALMADRAFT_265729 [Galerina marginata CBS 339.88]